MKSTRTARAVLAWAMFRATISASVTTCLLVAWIMFVNPNAALLIHASVR